MGPGNGGRYLEVVVSSGLTVLASGIQKNVYVNSSSQKILGSNPFSIY